MNEAKSRADARQRVQSAGRAWLASKRIDRPEPGHYVTKSARDEPWLPVRIWIDVPVDPLTGETLDRTHKLCAAVGREDVPAIAIWPYCAARPIDPGTYRCLLSEIPEVTSWSIQW